MNLWHEFCHLMTKNFSNNMFSVTPHEENEDDDSWELPTICVLSF